jgi:2'-5' RNA ligase
LIRSFIAGRLPAENLKLISKWISRLRKLDIHASFPRIESIHFTLKFLGDIDEEKVGLISEVLERSVQDSSRFNLRIEGMGTFPSLRNPRVVWMGIPANQVLLDLQERIEKKLVPHGFEAENRPFRPHLTLARIKSRKHLDQLQHFLQKDGVKADAGEFTFDSIHLYQSILRPTGAMYKCLSSHDLKEH